MSSLIPEACDVERSLVGAVMLNTALLYEVPWLDASHFYHPGCRIVFRRVSELAMAGKPTDLVTVSDELLRHDELTRIGGAAWLVSLTDGVVPNSKSVQHHAEIIREKFIRRELLNLCNASISRIADPTVSTKECLEMVEEQTLKLRSRGRATTHTAAEIMPEIIAELEALRQDTEHQPGLTTGLECLDLATFGGIRPAEYWVCGALSGRGKTVLAVQCTAANCKAGVPILFFSHEMTRKQLLRRALPAESGVSAAALRDPRFMSRSDWEHVKQVAESMESWPVSVCDPDSMTARELVAVATLHIRRYGVRLIVVDYLQLIEAPGKELHERVSNASNALRALAKNEGVPVLGLSQLSRPHDGNENSRPTMISLKQSGNIEAHAHVVLLLFRPKSEVDQWTGLDELIVGKQREGLTGTQAVRFDVDKLRFVERTRREAPTG